ncbi:MAG: AAA family ATPase [Elusimicrobia bacterium]|nr:AAA family ATPase [Elusimicrobiota bacterium]
MYQEYWGLSDLPFENTPDPRYFYESEKHLEALSRLQYLVRSRKACGVLTGVYGCGKTLVLHALMKSTEPEGCKFSIVTSPRLNDVGMLRMIYHNFHRGDVPPDKSDVLMKLEDTIRQVADDGKHSVIVIDEAHAIQDENVFEELRLLLNIQTETRFLVTLLLIGQPELKPRVEGNKQLNQRVSLRYHLGPFSLEDASNYIRHRMRVAGEKQPKIFPQATVELIHKQSGGIPRWINQICQMSLLIGMSKNAPSITPEIVQEASQDLVGMI